MNNNPRKKLVVLLTNRFAATAILHSGLARKLCTEYDLYLVSNLLDKSQLPLLNRLFGGKFTWADIPLPKETRRLRFLRHVQKALFFNHHQLATGAIKTLELGLLYRLCERLLFIVLQQTGLAAPLLRRIRKRILKATLRNPCNHFRSLTSFDGVLSTSPMDIRENILVNQLQQQGLRSMGMLIGWDNLSSKGVINADFHRILTWNAGMQATYNRLYTLYRIAGQAVLITGIPRFDLYYKPVTPSETVFRNTWGFSPSDSVILFTTCAIRHFPQQTDIVEHLLEYLTTRPRCKLFIRCHPFDNFEAYQRYRSHPAVRIWFPADLPNLSPERTVQGIPETDTLHTLSAMLNYCHVCLHVASTIRLDAIAAGIPCLAIAYDGNTPRNYVRSVRRLYDFTHQQAIRELQCREWVLSKAALFAALSRHLENSQKRTPAFDPGKLLHFTGPAATPATVSAIREWLN